MGNISNVERLNIKIQELDISIRGWLNSKKDIPKKTNNELIALYDRIYDITNGINNMYEIYNKKKLEPFLESNKKYLITIERGIKTKKGKAQETYLITTMQKQLDKLITLREKMRKGVMP